MGFLFQNEIGHDEEQEETKATSDCLRWSNSYKSITEVWGDFIVKPNVTEQAFSQYKATRIEPVALGSVNWSEST